MKKEFRYPVAKLVFLDDKDLISTSTMDMAEDEGDGHAEARSRSSHIWDD